MAGFIKRFLLMDDHVCPWWLAYSFDNPVRRLVHDPQSILGGLVRRGQTVVDLGCGMGHFSLGMARLVGEDGAVVAVDIQEQMLRRVRNRANAEGFSQRLKTHLARPDSIGLKTRADFILAFWMVHEVPDQESFFREISDLLKAGAGFLVVEPKIHVRKENFEKTLGQAARVGLQLVARPAVRLSRSGLFEKRR